MNIQLLPPEVYLIIAGLATLYDLRIRHRVINLFVGCLFAKGRRTITSWLRGAHVLDEWRLHYYAASSVGRNYEGAAGSIVQDALNKVETSDRMELALDDTVGERFGPCVEGAGTHRNPTPGPANQKHVYGHVWVTASLIAVHPLWGPIGLPLLAMLYVRDEDVSLLPEWYHWTFQTKLELAAKIVEWAANIAKSANKKLWVTADGAYAKRPFLKRAMAAGATVFSRLRQDAALWTLPEPSPPGTKGRRPTYGKERIYLWQLATDPENWKTGEFFLYGELQTVMYKAFQATYKLVGGKIYVVIVKTDDGWRPYFCTDPEVSVADILEMMAKRNVIEENYHDLKEVDGMSQQQTRNIWASVGAMLITCWNFTLLELWAWDKPAKKICDRSASPWDQTERRPSHADRRRAFQRVYFQEQFSQLPQEWQRKRKIRRLFKEMLSLAA